MNKLIIILCLNKDNLCFVLKFQNKKFITLEKNIIQSQNQQLI